jgi:hypothetical protein
MVFDDHDHAHDQARAGAPMPPRTRADAAQPAVPPGPAQPAVPPWPAQPAVPPGPAPTGLGARLAVIRTQVDALAAVAPRDLDGAAAVGFFDDVFELSDRLTAIAVRVLPVLEADGRWATGPTGARTFPTWVAHRTRTTHAHAHRLTRLGRALRDDLTRTGAAVVAPGPDRIGSEQAQILTTIAATSPTRRAVLADPDHPVGEQFLLDQARLLPADALRTLARRWAAAADPDADDRGYTDATEREYLDLAATTGGCHLTGFLTTEHSQTLAVALDAVTARPATSDHRTHPQRRAGALTDLARTALDHALVGTGARVRPHLNVLIDYPTLTALATTTANPDQHPSTPTGTTPTGAGARPTAAGLNPAVFDDGQPVPRAVLDKLMCDSDLSRTIFGPDSQILNVGRTKRLYPPALRRAIIARDHHCQYPGCTAPPRLCEGHHTQHWARDHGTTDARTGILLCWHHHTRVHDTGTEITWKTPDGWHFTDRHGQPLKQ